MISTLNEANEIENKSKTQRKNQQSSFFETHANLPKFHAKLKIPKMYQNFQLKFLFSFEMP